MSAADTCPSDRARVEEHRDGVIPRGFFGEQADFHVKSGTWVLGTAPSAVAAGLCPGDRSRVEEDRKGVTPTGFFGDQEDFRLESNAWVRGKAKLSTPGLCPADRPAVTEKRDGKIPKGFFGRPNDYILVLDDSIGKARWVVDIGRLVATTFQKIAPGKLRKLELAKEDITHTEHFAIVRARVIAAIVRITGTKPVVFKFDTAKVDFGSVKDAMKKATKSPAWTLSKNHDSFHYKRYNSKYHEVYVPSR